MALFKILRGDSSRISMGTTPFHDGYAYFTPDDGGFYTDAETSGVEKRIRVNPSSKSVTATLLASGWNNSVQTVSIQGLGADQNGYAGLPKNVTKNQKTAALRASIRLTGQAAGSLTFTADGVVPSVDIPIVVILE